MEDIHAALRRMGLLVGDYVRAELREAGGGVRTLRKDDGVHEGMVVRIAVNKKVAWQSR